jgi:hypothetical protein
MSQKIFTVSDYEVHALGTELEAWVPSDTKRIMLSLVVQMDGRKDQVETFRKCALELGLSRQQTLLGLHRLGCGGLLELDKSSPEIP